MRAHRNGFALPVALLALVIVGALVTGGFFAANQEDQISTVTMHANEAFFAAERGLQDILGVRNRIFFEDSICPVGDVAPCDELGDTTTIGPVSISVGGLSAQYTVTIRHLATRLFLVESEGEVFSGGRYGGGTRTLAQLVRTSYMDYARDRAVQTKAPIAFRGNSYVSGADSVPPGWSDCTDLGTKTGIMTNDATNIDFKGKALTGDPPDSVKPDLGYDDFFNYGDLTYDDLARVAEKTVSGTMSSLAPVDDGVTCDTGNLNNWGDPLNPTAPCGNYFPIIHAPGDVHLSGGGYGQGILLVDGDLSVTGGFNFYGIIIVKGAAKLTGKGNTINGSILIWGQSDSTSQIGETKGTGSTTVDFSSCAVERAHLYNTRLSRPYPVYERSFIDLSAIGAQENED